MTTDLKDALSKLGDVALTDDDHPSPDDLVAYQEGMLEDISREFIQSHVAWCSTCAQAILDLATYPEIELRDTGLARSPEEESEDWQTIQRALKEIEHEDRNATARLLPWWRDRAVQLLAASLLVTTIGLASWVASLKQEIAELSSPQANIFIASLDAVAATTKRSADQARVTRVPEGTEAIVLFLTQENFDLFEDYRVELLDRHERLVWQHRGLVSSSEGGFCIEIPLVTLQPDFIEIRLYGLRKNEDELLATYRTRIERLPAK